MTLFFANGTVADTVLTVRTERNQSYARTADGSWTATYDVTPGFANTSEGREAYVRSLGFSEMSVRITELMADNKSILADAAGRFHDWVELCNTGDRAVALSGWFLSDDETDLTQWKIPDCTIEAGQRLLIFLAGNLDGEIDGALFAPMSLSAAGETVYLVDPIGQIRDRVTFDAIEENRSLVIDPQSGAQRVSICPTPGFADTDDGYAQFCETLVSGGALAIWEVMTANDAYLPQSGEFFDWLELKNTSSEPIRLGAFSISDDSKHPDRCPLPDVTLAPGDFYLVILSGHAAYTTQRAFHADFALNAQEDSLFLFENGRLIDYAHLYALPYRTTYGRSANHGGFFYMSPTPGAENESGSRMVSAAPTASVAPGVYQSAAGIDVTLEAGGTIYYTTDCSDPTERSAVYTGPVHLDRSAIIRAVSYEPGKKESGVVTLSYLLNEPHDLPVVSLVTDPWHLWDSAKGIYVDSIHRKEIEYPASVAYFGDDGTWAKECGIKMHGVSSLKDIDKHSFTVKFSGVYGGPLHYDVFGDGEVTTFQSVILRADYESTWASFIRDNMLHSIAKQYSPTMLSQNYKYVVLYLNGSYWGIYAIREQYTPFYYASNLGVPEDTVTVCKNYMTSADGLADVYRYVMQHDMSNAAHYAYVAERLDLSSFIDWAIFEAYCGNSDISGNVRYLYSSVDGKWRCGLVDADLGFFHQNAFSYVLDAPQVGTLLQRLLKNETFRAQLLTRLSELLSTGLSDASVTARIDEMAAMIRSEIPFEKQRWPKVGNWENLIVSLKGYVNGRSRKIISSIRSELGVSNAEAQRYFGSLA